MTTTNTTTTTSSRQDEMNECFNNEYIYWWGKNNFASKKRRELNATFHTIINRFSRNALKHLIQDIKESLSIANHKLAATNNCTSRNSQQHQQIKTIKKQFLRNRKKLWALVILLRLQGKQGNLRFPPHPLPLQQETTCRRK